jgi:hypothetical protein
MVCGNNAVDFAPRSLMVSLSNHEAGSPSSFDRLRMRASH